MKCFSRLIPKFAILLFVFPVNGWISSGFGERIDPFTGRKSFHSGIDIASKYAEGVRSVDSGKVLFAGKKKGYGNLVIISESASLERYYAHMGRIFVKGGEKVVKGQLLGWMGMSGKSTGPHIHYEIRIGGRAVDPSGTKSSAKNFFNLR